MSPISAKRIRYVALKRNWLSFRHHLQKGLWLWKRVRGEARGVLPLRLKKLEVPRQCRMTGWTWRDPKTSLNCPPPHQGPLFLPKSIALVPMPQLILFMNSGRPSHPALSHRLSDFCPQQKGSNTPLLATFAHPAFTQTCVLQRPKKFYVCSLIIHIDFSHQAQDLTPHPCRL